VLFESGSQLEIIGAYAFYGLSNLKSFDLPDSVTTIGHYAFAGNVSSTAFNISLNSALLTIGEYAFSNNKKLTTILLLDTITSLGIRAFYECSSLQTINIPLGITVIESGLFFNCTSLETVIFPEGSQITIISPEAFINNFSLININLPETLISITSYAFSNCMSLVSFYLPDSVSFIGSFAFYNDLSLVISVEAETKPVNWENDWAYFGPIEVLFAVNHRSITLIPDNGENEIVIFQKIGTVVIPPTNPEKLGYIFGGWYLDEGSFLVPYVFDVMPEESVTLYAKWIPE